MSYDMVEMNYNKGLWPIEMVQMAVRKGIITREEYKTITGKEYSARKR